MTAGARRRRGITIVEVLVAILLLGGVFGGSFALISQATAMMRRTRNHYVATTLCLARIERARDFDYNLLSFLAEAGTLVDPEGVPDADGFFRRQTAVFVDDPRSGVTTLDVRVEIRDPKTREFEGAFEEMSAAFTTYLDAPTP